MREGIKKNGLEDFIGGEKKKKDLRLQGDRFPIRKEETMQMYDRWKEQST